VSQRGVQLVIGKLVTDEDFRRRFEERGADSLNSLSDRGVDLNGAEVAALLEADRRLWSRIAKLIDPRLQKIALMSQRDDQGFRKQLTVRQQQVLHGIFDGLTNKEIATKIGVSEGAVKATLQQLFRKTQVRTRAQLVRIAIESPLHDSSLR
jgi:DNA-binding NarL/FixJ family response regulator